MELENVAEDDIYEISDEEEQMFVTDAEQQTPLHVAAAEGDVTQIQTLLQSEGACVDSQTKIRGHTPLHKAVIKGHLSSVAELLEAGADPDARDHAGIPPLRIAAGNGRMDIVRMLVDKGCYLDAAGNDGATALFLAANNGREAVVKELLKHGRKVFIFEHLFGGQVYCTLLFLVSIIVMHSRVGWVGLQLYAKVSSFYQECTIFSWYRVLYESVHVKNGQD